MTVTGNSAEFTFENILSGAYTLRISKKNHATREYTIIIEKDSAPSEYKIHLLGDINGNGKVNTLDVARANAFAKGTSKPDSYQFVCADVNADGKVNTLDVAMINSHAKNISLIWK